MVAQAPFEIKQFIRTVPDFPKKGIMFRDITTLLQNGDAFHQAMDGLCNRYANQKIDKIVGIESRGFIVGSVMAYRLCTGFVPIRKTKKLPYQTIRQEYQLEYGTDAVEMHTDGIQHGESVLVVDDLIATGGTVEAACKLVERVGGRIAGIAVLIELSFLHPRDRLKSYDLYAMASYDSE